ncbi:MAG: SurA N-terminal domain-containing protein [Nitrospirae bacterium]|nr:SurA N-terminal domain-containing protein [Nitrospirota bacterium]
MKGKRAKEKVNEPGWRSHLAILPFAFALSPFSFIAAFLAFTLGLSPFPSIAAANPLTLDTIVAVVNGDPITYYDLKTAYTFAHMEAVPKHFDPQSQKSKDLRDFLEKLVEDKIIAQEVSRRGVRVSDEEVDAQIAEFRTRYGFTTEKGFVQALEQQGMTLQSYRERMTEEMKKHRLVEMDVRSRIDVTDAMIQAYYSQHRAELAQPARVALSEIVLKKPADGLPRVMERLRAGEDFHAVARDVSQSTATASKGGQLGMIDLADLDLGLRAQIERAQPGSLIGPIETGEAVRLLKVDRVEAHRQPPLDDVRDRISEILLDEAHRTELRKWMDELRARAVIETHWD